MSDLKGIDNYPEFPKILRVWKAKIWTILLPLVNATVLIVFLSWKRHHQRNGLKYWEALWQRRKEIKNCTNLEFEPLWTLSGLHNVQLQDCKLINAGFGQANIINATILKY
jgi:hypothetical protein